MFRFTNHSCNHRDSDESAPAEFPPEQPEADIVEDDGTNYGAEEVELEEGLKAELAAEEAKAKAEGEDEEMAGVDEPVEANGKADDEDSDAGSEDLEAESSGSDDEDGEDEEGEGEAEDDMEMGEGEHAGPSAEKQPAMGHEAHAEVMVH